MLLIAQKFLAYLYIVSIVFKKFWNSFVELTSGVNKEKILSIAFTFSHVVALLFSFLLTSLEWDE